MRKNARFKIISYFCGVMNKQYFIISLKKEVFVSCFLIGLFFLEGGNCYASEQQVLRGTIEVPSDHNTVRGRVIDIYGEPLIGATIREKGGANGTVTDIDGKFFLSVPDSAVLQVSFVGYKTVEVNVAGRNVLEIRLLPYKRVLVCFRLYLSTINILFLQTNHALFNQYGDDCIKIKVDAFNHMIGSKAVDCCER